MDLYLTQKGANIEFYGGFLDNYPIGGFLTLFKKS